MPPTHTDKPAAREKKLRRRPWLILGGLFLAALSALGWLMFSHDAPPPDDADMLPLWSGRGGDANPLAASCRVMETSGIHDDGGVPDGAWRADPRDRRQMEAYLTRHAGVLKAFDDLTATDATQWQWPQAGTHHAPQDTEPYANLMDVAYALHAQAIYKVAEGKGGEAQALCLKLARTGSGMLNAEGGFHELQTAQRVLREGASGLEKVLVDRSATPAQVRECLQELALTGSMRGEDLQFALKSHYGWFKQQIQQEGRERLLQYMDQIDLGARPGELLRFKRNHTLAGLLPWHRMLLQGMDKGRHETLLAMRQAFSGCAAWSAEHRALGYLTDYNSLGKNMVRLRVTQTNALLGHILRLDSLHSQNLIILALRLHELEHGALPPTLDALAPAYLPVVPRDVYSGKPMRWNPTTRVVYAVGEDGQDDGGHFVSGWMDSRDLSTPYWWRGEASPSPQAAP